MTLGGAKGEVEGDANKPGDMGDASRGGGGLGGASEVTGGVVDSRRGDPRGVDGLGNNVVRGELGGTPGTKDASDALASGGGGANDALVMGAGAQSVGR
ncbi:unnamed protein product [Ilex paraguariensis]|uniref:Uncharacterized protein n=1 Tax=Ilex paraguariensis TaxID=185542 RepID=A0ABC8TV40_9AQUA